MSEMYCTQCGHDPLLQADNDRRNRAELAEAKARIAELEAVLKELALAAANDMRHADDASDAGWVTLKELSDALAKANRLTQPMPAAPEVDNAS